MSPDHPGREGQHIARVDAQLTGHQSTHLDSIFDAALASRHIGVLTIDHDRLGEAIRDVPVRR